MPYTPAPFTTSAVISQATKFTQYPTEINKMMLDSGSYLAAQVALLSAQYSANTGYSAAVLDGKFGQRDNAIALKANTADVYQKSVVDNALTIKTNNIDLVGAIGNINSPLLDMPLKNSLAMKAGVGSATFTRASTATYIDRYGVLKPAAIDEPRFEKEGYLNEGSSTNLLLYSEQFDNTYWHKEALTLTANTVDTLDPYGTNLADKIMETAVTLSHAVYTGPAAVSFTGGVTYTQSWFIKPNGRTKFRITTWAGAAFTTNRAILIDLVAKTSIVIEETVISHGIIELPNGWFRVWFSATADATATQYSAMVRPRLDDGVTETYLGDVTKGFYIFGAQIEALPFASSYIPTVASAVTRANDNLKVAAIGNIGSGWAAKTIIVDSSALGVRENSRVFDLLNVNYNMIRYGANGTAMEGYYSPTGLIVATTIKNKHRFTYQLLNDSKTVNTVRLYVDGVLGGERQSQAGALGDLALTWIQLGSSGSGTEHTYGHISNLRVYDRALTAQEVALA